MKKIVSLGLTVAMILSLVACGGGNGGNAGSGTPDSTPAGGQEQGAEQGGEEQGGDEQQQAASNVIGAFEDPANTEKSDEQLGVVLSSEPAVLYGAAAGQVVNEANVIINAITDPLVFFDQQTGDILPRLATSWEWVDATHCKFTLRDDVIMSDGTPLVADDVVYTCNSIWRDLNATNDTGQFIAEEGAVAEDEHTVTIAFNTAAPDLLSMLAWSNFGIVTEDEINALGGFEAAAKNPVLGSGRYKFKEWVNGQYVLLERNEDYWDDSYVGYFKEIKITFTTDAASREMAVESGDAQVAYDMPVAQAATYAGNSAVKVVLHPFGQITHLWFNLGENGNPALQDANVRKAITLALDYDALNAVGTAGYGKVAYGYFEENSKYYNQTYSPEEKVRDVEQAKALLEEAGYGSGLTLKILGLQDTVPAYTVMQANLAEVGITLEMDIPDTPTFVGQAAGGDYDLIQVGDYVSARYPSLVIFFQMGGVYGFSIGGPKWTTEEIHNSIIAAIEEPDEAKAKEMFGAFEQMCKENTYYTDLFTEMHGNVIASDIKGFQHIERGFIDITNFYK